LLAASAYTMKHPPEQLRDDVARDQLDAFIKQYGEER